MSGNALSNIDIVVLAGGKGTRIQPVLGDVPKLLAPIGERTYLDYLLDWLQSFGASRVILSLGHQATRIVDYVTTQPRDDLEIIPVIEEMPLGTAGAHIQQVESLRWQGSGRARGTNEKRARTRSAANRLRADRAIEAPKYTRAGGGAGADAGAVGEGSKAIWQRGRPHRSRRHGRRIGGWWRRGRHGRWEMWRACDAHTSTTWVVRTARSAHSVDARK